MPDGTVPVAEEFDDTRSMTRMLLGMKGCRVIEAVNGREAAEAASRHCSELDLLDESIGRSAARGGRDVRRGRRR